MRTVLNGVLVVLGGVVLAVLGLLVVRRIWPAGVLGDSNEVGDDFITVLGTAYGVLVAFVVSTVWGRFTDSEREADAEANQIFTLLHLTELMNGPAARSFHRHLLDYAHSLVDDEWRLLASGTGSDRTGEHMEALWDDYRDIEATAQATPGVLASALDRLAQLTDYRRMRLFNSDDAVPTILWILLTLEGVITVAFTYLLVAPTLFIQVLMTAALAATIGTSLYLIGTLNHPFAGVPRVTDENIRTQLVVWETKVEHRARTAVPRDAPGSS